MLEITPKLLEALNAAERSVDGLDSLAVVAATEGLFVKGKRQDCDCAALGPHEWVDQKQYGDDAFSGTVSWRIDRHWLIASFNT